MNSKSWVDKMMNKYDGALNYKDKQIADMDARHCPPTASPHYPYYPTPPYHHATLPCHHATHPIITMLHPLITMLHPHQARDWRIFREDNEIVTKGNMRHPATGKQILPFRYWPESLMPEEARHGYLVITPSATGPSHSCLRRCAAILTRAKLGAATLLTDVRHV